MESAGEGRAVDCAMEKIRLGVGMVLIVRWRELEGMLAPGGGGGGGEFGRARGICNKAMERNVAGGRMRRIEATG